MKVVEITWDDAWCDSDGMTVKKASKSKAIRTISVGYLVSNNEFGLTIATDIYERDKKNVKIVNFIPHCMVIEWAIYE